MIYSLKTSSLSSNATSRLRLRRDESVGVIAVAIGVDAVTGVDVIMRLELRGSPHLLEPSGSLFVPVILNFLFSLSGMRMRGGAGTALLFPLFRSGCLSVAIGSEAAEELIVSLLFPQPDASRPLLPGHPHPDPAALSVFPELAPHTFCVFPHPDPAVLSASLFPQPAPLPSFLVLPQPDSVALSASLSFPQLGASHLPFAGLPHPDFVGLSALPPRPCSPFSGFPFAVELASP